MQKIFFLICTFVFNFSLDCLADPPMNELYIYNRSNIGSVYIKLYPSSGIFNGVQEPGEVPEYSIYSQQYDGQPTSGANRQNTSQAKIISIVGLDGYALNDIEPGTTYDGYFEIENNRSCEFSHDCTPSGAQDGLIGYGIYILEIYKYEAPNFTPICNPITIDWLDFNYTTTATFGQLPDLTIYIRGFSSSDIYFQWTGQNQTTQEIHVFGNSPYPAPSPALIQVYKQYLRYTDEQIWEGYNVPTVVHPRSLGNSISNQFNTVFPANGRSLASPYTIPTHNYSGLLYGNLTINHNIDTWSTLYNNPTELKLLGSSLIINDNKTLNISTVAGIGYNNLIIEDNSNIVFRDNSKINVYGPNRVTLESLSSLKFKGNNSELRMKSGSTLCYRGGYIGGKGGGIILEPGSHQVDNCTTVSEIPIKDSAKVMLLDSATLQIPDNFTLKLKGNTTSLILKPYSKIKFGEHSKIVLDSGAKLIANNATFTSSDSTKTWDGIYCTDTKQDTIANCKIINAKGGINFINKLSSSRSMVKD